MPKFLVPLLVCGMVLALTADAAEVRSMPSDKRPRSNRDVKALKSPPVSLSRIRPERVIKLPALEAGERQRIEQQDSTNSQKRVRLGIGRGLPAPLIVNSAGRPEEWTRTGEGAQLWSGQIDVDGARALRLHIEEIRIPKDASIRIYSSTNPVEPGTIITAQTLGTNDDVWTASVHGPSAVVECSLPATDPAAAMSFKISEVSHIYRDLKAAAQSDVSCIPQIACYPDFLDSASGVALMQFVDKAETFLCTGCLLNDADPSTFIDYFLTAHHCIPNAKVAATLELFWLYEAGVCGGAEPSPFSGPHTTGGATLLATSGHTDFTLLRLRQPAPDSATFLGWTTATPGAGETVSCIQHPGGLDKRISFGPVVDSDLTDWYTLWTTGATEAGSSGSPLLNSRQELIGQLEGGVSSCSNPQGEDGFGRFDVTYKAVKRWVDSGPFISKKGVYNGLFAETNTVAHESSGYITVKMNERGSYSGYLLCSGVRYGLSGKFKTDGTATRTVKGKGNVLTVTLAYDLSVGGSNLFGTVSSSTGGWTSDIFAEPAPYNARTNAPTAQGNYTVIFSPEVTGVVPPGNSFGTIRIDANGKIRFAGSLADAISVSQGALLTAANYWPVYLPLYKGKGSVWGWVRFAAEPNSDLAGDISWIKKPQAAKFYPGGFTNVLSVIGFRYNKPASGGSALGAASGTFTADGGGLASTYTSAVTISGGRIIGSAGSPVKFSISPRTGLVSGKFQPPGAAHGLPGRGVVLQRLDSIYGYFIGATETGSFSIITP